MFQAIAIHHPRPEHVEAFLAFAHRVIDVVGPAPGLLEFSVFRDAEGPRLVGLSRWESPEDFQAALPAIMGMGAERRDEWSAAPDEVIMATLA